LGLNTGLLPFPILFIMTSELNLTLNVSPGTEDGVVRIDPSDMRLLGVVPGDIVALVGIRTCYARVQPAFMEDRNQRLALGSQTLVRNTGFRPGSRIQVSAFRQEPALAEKVTLQVEDDIDQIHLMARARMLSNCWHERTVLCKDWLGIPSLDRNPLYAQVIETLPGGLVQIGSGTEFSFIASGKKEGAVGLAGLRDLYRTCMSLAGARIKERIAGSARSVLLTGPSGCGKATLVKRLAEDMELPLFVLDAHNLLDRRLLDNSAETGLFLAEVARKGPCIILLDHLGALAMDGRAAEPLAAAVRSVLAQISAALEEAMMHNSIMTFGVSSDPVTAYFREFARFDLTLPVDVPNRLERQEILLLATRHVPLAGDVDLRAVASATSGAVARDLKQLVTIAASLSRKPKVDGEDFAAAFRHLEPMESKIVRCDIPDVPWHDIAGLDEIKQLIRETLVWSLCPNERLSSSGIRPPRSILLSGGQGTGKTSLARALAWVIPLNFIEINCNSLSPMDAAAAAEIVHESFLLARRKTPCLVFMDDIDVLFTAHSETSEGTGGRHPVIAQLLNELDGLAGISGVVVIAATNRPDRLSVDIMRPGRFDYAVTLPMPDHNARSKILQIHARKLPLAADVDFDRLAAATQSFSPAELVNLCNRVGLMAMRQSMDAEQKGVVPPVVNAALFDQALRGRK